MPLIDVYPYARLNRQAAGLVAGGLGTLPRVNLHPWFLTATGGANRQRSVVFGPFTGAGVVKRFSYAFTAGVSVDAHVGLRVTPDNAKDGIEEARGTLIGGRPLTSGKQSGATVLTPYDQGFEAFTTSPDGVKAPGDLNVPVTDDRFFLTITVTMPGAAWQITGLLIVWDAIPQADLLNFL